MTDSSDIKKLIEYRCQINSMVVESLKDSVTKLNESMAMISDLQSINEELTSEMDKADKVNQVQASEIESLRKSIDEMKAAVQEAEDKRKLYDSMNLSMARVTALLSEQEGRKAELDEMTFAFNQEKQEFEKAKNEIIDSKNEAEDKARRYLNEKNEAIRSRDNAIAERDVITKDYSELENIAEGLKKEKEKLETEKARLKNGKEKFETEKTDLIAEIEKLKYENNSLTEARDYWRTAFNNLKNSNDKKTAAEEENTETEEAANAEENTNVGWQANKEDKKVTIACNETVSSNKNVYRREAPEVL